MTRTIAIIGGKGGVGKTTLTSNLACSLSNMGEDVIAIDTNLTTPNLGLHIGMHLPEKTLHEVLKGEVPLNEAIYNHPFGFKFIPSSISTESLTGVDPEKLHDVTFKLTGKSDYILMDCAAGLGKEAISAMSAADEILVVTNPDMPSAVDALKVIDIARQMRKPVIGAVVNRRRGKENELGNRKIRRMLDVPILSEIPEDSLIADSIMAKQPLVEYSPNSKSAIEIERLAHRIAGRRYYRRKKTFSERVMELFRLK